MKNHQKPSKMPFERYEPFHDQISVELADRTWPTKENYSGATVVRC